jgi:hypothetical protein
VWSVTNKVMYTSGLQRTLVKGTGFRACVRTQFSSGRQPYGLRKSSVLYQGTTLVGPKTIEKTSGFSPCHSTSQTKCSSAGNFRCDLERPTVAGEVSSRLKATYQNF